MIELKIETIILQAINKLGCEKVYNILENNSHIEAIKKLYVLG